MQTKQQDEQIKAWVTKYSLTEGILCVNGNICHSINSGMLEYNNYGIAHGKDWHRTEEDALKRAEEMRINKIMSLKKSISKMEKLEFNIIDKNT